MSSRPTTTPSAPSSCSRPGHGRRGAGRPWPCARRPAGRRPAEEGAEADEELLGGHFGEDAQGELAFGDEFEGKHEDKHEANTWARTKK